MRAFMYGAWLAALLLWIAGCGDSTLEGLGGSAGAGGTGGGPGTGGTGGRIGVEPPPAPDPGCNTDDLACEHGDHSSVFAIAHGFYGTSPPTTLVYRVQVDAWTDETSLMHGDGQDNGFYYLVRVNNGKPSSVDSGQRVPFNGFRASADGSLSLPAFEFTVVVDVSETPLAQTSLEVLACAATNDTSGTGGHRGLGGHRRHGGHQRHGGHDTTFLRGPLLERHVWRRYGSAALASEAAHRSVGRLYETGLRALPNLDRPPAGLRRARPPPGGHDQEPAHDVLRHDV